MSGVNKERFHIDLVGATDMGTTMAGSARPKKKEKKAGSRKGGRSRVMKAKHYDKKAPVKSLNLKPIRGIKPPGGLPKPPPKKK